MSSLVNPVGPEEPRIYWVRRGVVVLAVVLVAALLIWAIRPGQESTVATVPSEPATTQQTPSSSATPTPDASSSPSAAASSAASTTPTAAPSSTTASAAPTSTTPQPSTTPAPATSSAPPAVAACKPSDLRVTLTGPPNATSGEAVSFELSVINGSANPCTVNVTAESLELKIYSGTDRIWTTLHCPDWVPAIAGELAPEKSTAWSMAWPAKRSAPNCTIRDDVLRPGTYVATAQLSGAKPVQHVMSLR